MNIFVIEDNLDHLELIQDLLLSVSYTDISVASATSLAEGLAQLDQQHYDLCLCDLNLPDSNIEETVNWMMTQSLSVPIVALTSLNSLELAQELLQQGIQDYIPKEELTSQLLYRTCRYAIERFKHQQVIAEHNKDMKAFCSSLSHDFNGHIGRIQFISDTIKTNFANRVRFTDEDNTWFEYLDTSAQAVQLLVTNLHQYLSLGHSPNNLKTVSLHDVLQLTHSTIKLGTEVEFDLIYPPNMPSIQGNSELLQLLFQNLISNSIKFNNNHPVININCRDTDDQVVVTITDNGIGFSSSQAEKIFSPFYRLATGKKYNGSGLGLSIVKRVIEHHHGDIQVSSEVDVGSTFTLVFPKSQPA